MRKFNPYRNIFYYYRGQNRLDRKNDIQIEDNTTKALINTLELSEKSLLQFFLNSFNISVSSQEPVTYDLQVAESLSRPDALIKIGRFKVYIESKVHAPLLEDQIRNHLDCIEKSILLIITAKETDRRVITELKDPRLKFITWQRIYLQFYSYLLKYNKSDQLILKQFLNYLENINMAPFKGFYKEDFDAFLYVEDDPKKEIRSIVKHKFGKYLEELSDKVKNKKDFKGLKEEVGNLNKKSHSIWGTLSDSSEKKVNVPHFNFLINRNKFFIGFIVEGKNPSVKFYKNIRQNISDYFKLLKNLDGFEIELQHRIYIRPRVFRNVTVARIKCGEDITLTDVKYMLQKIKQYPLILTWCYVTIPRDDKRLNSEKFIYDSINYLKMLMPLYKFSKAR